jgi:hypothetical protein
MRKITLLFRLLALVACLSCALGASAYDFVSNGIYYNITGDRTVEVTNNSTYSYSGSVTIPSMVSNAGTVYQVTRIGGNAFSYCENVTSVSIPNSVTSIGSYAFASTGLTQITIPASVTSISDHVVFNCSKLVSITVASGNTVYDSRNNCNAIIETATNTLLSACKTTVIPQTVTVIDDNAFASISDLTSVTIPNGVTTIGENAFYGCTGLTSVIIPNSVTIIRDNAFRNCSNLSNLVIGSGVTFIGDYAFAECAFTFFNCLATVPPTIFNNTFKPKTSGSGISVTKVVYVPKGCKSAYESANIWNDFNIYELLYDFEVNGIYYTITGDRTVEVAPNPHNYAGSINIPSMTSYNGTVYQVKGIGEGAFSRCYSLTSVTIPNSITTIGDGAFLFCISLTSVTIPQSVTSIGYLAFIGCSGLTSITVASGNTIYDSRNNCNALIETASNTLLAGCNSTVIPNTVTAIGDYAFYNCTSLTSVAFSNSLTSIGVGAFYQCAGLTSVIIGSGVTNIGDGAFDDCTALTSVTCLATTPPSIQSSAFETDTYSNATLYVPAASKDAYQAADGWKDFTHIRAVPYDFMVDGICYKITGTNTVDVCENPAQYSGNVVIPSTVTYGGKTYQVTGIRTYAFYDCDGLTGVTIPNTVTTIGDAAFSGCDNLTTVTIPNSVTRIGWYAFAYCNGLTSVTIGSGVTTIDDNAFAGCPALTSVTCLATTPPTLGEDVFYSDTYENATLKVPSASLNAYRTANSWRNFFHIVAAGMRGDVNSDGNVNISDVTMLINYLINGNTTGIDMTAADTTLDENVNISDAISLINYLSNNVW